MPSKSEKILQEYKEAYVAANGKSAPVAEIHGSWVIWPAIGGRSHRLSELVEMTTRLRLRATNKELEKRIPADIYSPAARAMHRINCEAELYFSESIKPGWDIPRRIQHGEFEAYLHAACILEEELDKEMES